jgi:TolB-like protein
MLFFNKKELSMEKNNGGFLPILAAAVFFTFLTGVIFIPTACTGTPAATTGVVPPAVPGPSISLSPPVPSAQEYWTGDGGAGLSIAVLVPEGKGLAAGEDFLPAMAQGVLVGDFTKFSAIKVLDRQNLEKVIAEGESGYYADENNFVKLGEVANVGYVLNGALQKTGTGFSLQLKITDAASGMSRAAYTGSCSEAELADSTGVKKASAELLAQLGVRLTDAGKASLLGVDKSDVQAQTALAKGITAQRSGAEVAALISYYQAAAFDPSLLEAASRASVLSANISSGNIGMDARNDIQWRKDWIARLTETERYFDTFFKTSSPPAAVYYSTGLTWGKVNYQQETVPCSFEVNLHSYSNWFAAVQRALQAVYDGLDRTGRKREWGLSDWPASTLTGYRAFSEGKRFAVIFELVNDRREVIGRQSVNLDINWSVSINRDVKVTYNQNDFETLRYNVKADGITDNTAIRIASVNGQNPEAAARANSLSLMAISAEEWAGTIQMEKRFSNGTIISGGDKISGSLYITTIWGEPVTAIGDKAFAAYSGLTSVTIPNSVTTIGDFAFAGCEGLTSVTIPNSVTTIGDWAFVGCSGLTSVSIPSSVTTIGDSAFAGCEGLTSITIPSSVTSIGEGAFLECSGLTSVTIPNSVTTISGTFVGCSRLTSVTIPNGVTTIGDWAFVGCSGLTSVSIPSSVTSIGERAFSDCSGLTSVTIPSSVTTIGDKAFEDCERLISVSISGSVTAIGDEAFFGGNRLRKAYLTGGVGTYVRSSNRSKIWKKQ